MTEQKELEPKAWKLVPIRPTEAMLRAGAAGSGEDSEDVAAGAWDAMLAATPTPHHAEGDAVGAALEFYGQEAEALARYWDDMGKVHAVQACLTVIRLDGGKRAAEAASTIAALQSRLAEVTRERDEARDYAKQVRLRENAAEDARVSAVDRASRAESTLASARAEARREGLEEAAKAGWNACRKSIYAVCEDVQKEAERIRIQAEVGSPSEEFHAKGYYSGTCTSAKSIARGFGAMEAEDDDNFQAAIRALIPADAQAEKIDRRCDYCKEHGFQAPNLCEDCRALLSPTDGRGE